MALGIQMLALLLLLASAASIEETKKMYELKLWRTEDTSQEGKLLQVYKEIEMLRHDQALMKQQQEEMNQAIKYCSQMQHTDKDVNQTTLPKGYSTMMYPFLQRDDEDDEEEEEGEEEGEEEEEGGKEENDAAFDPCYHYTILNQAWRATNYSTKKVACDRQVNWKGWYRLYLRGKSIQMPEICVKKEMCGTHAPLWLNGGHPRIRDGIVTRKVCGHWRNNCCAFKSPPIQVKACRGNYYVYKFVKPLACHLAYCADVNTLVCGRCKKNEICSSGDKINWFCKKTKRKVKVKVHFFASYPASLSGKVNRIQYRKVYVNVGRAFNRRTGVFTAPVAGAYQFFFSTQSANNGVKTDLWLVVNGYWVSVSHTHVGRGKSVGNLSTYMTYLRKGALVYVTHNCGNSWASSSSNTITFGGSLLSKIR